MSLLSLKNLTVRFGGLTAVNAFDLEVDDEKIFSVIGPNGAGKTTVFNVITGIYEPTAGTIKLAGRDLRRPLTTKVVAMFVLFGVATAIAAALAAANVDWMWRAAIKRNYVVPAEFTYAIAWHDTLAYLRGELDVERLRGGRFAVVTADGLQTLGYAINRDEAEKLRDDLSAVVAAGDFDTLLGEQDGKWIIAAPGSGTVLASLDTEQAARARLAKFADIRQAQIAHRRSIWLALVFGLVIGTSGAWTVWNRARRTPDVIADAGIARTFQNIRLFQNMTVLENVLTGMDRHFHKGVWQMALRTPGVRREEAAGRERAMELLKFVSLTAQAGTLAKNLPYGDQRRLEIARALATEPKLVLLDEPAAGMNPAESADLTKLIERIRQRGIGVLLIEHHMKVVMGISDRIAVLDYGSKIAEGTPGEVRANPAVIKAYLGSEEVN